MKPSWLHRLTVSSWRRLALAPAALFIVGTLHAQTAPNHVTTTTSKLPAPITLLSFDEGTGIYAADSVGDHPATLIGQAGWTAGLVGPYALSLPGLAGSYADITSTVVDTTQSFSVAAWVKLNNTNGYQTFVSEDTPGGEAAFFLQLRAVGKSPFGLAISSDGSTLYVSQFISPGAITVIDLAHGNTKQTISGLDPYPLGIALSPDGAQLWVAAGNIDRIDTANNKVLHSVTVLGGCERLAFTPNGKKVYASGRSGKITVVSTVTNKVTAGIRIASASISEEPAGIVISGQQAFVLVDLGFNELVGWLFTINTVTNKVVQKTNLG